MTLQSDQEEETLLKSTLFVRNLPYEATSTDLSTFFSGVGPLKSAFVVTDKENGNVSKGYGFVQYVLPEDATRAVEQLSKVKFAGTRVLKMELAVKKGIEMQVERPKKRKREAERTVEIEKKQQEKVAKQTVILSNLSAEVTQKAIYKKARKFGTVQNVIYPVGDDSKTAHIIYETQSIAIDAVGRLNDHVFKGSKVSAILQKELSSDKRSRLIIRNLSFKVRETQLRDLLSQHGVVISFNIPRKHTGGPLRGFAFVWMATRQAAEAVIKELNMKEIEGRTVAVDFALSKDKYEEAIKEEEEEENQVESENEEHESDDENLSKDDEKVESGKTGKGQKSMNVEDDESKYDSKINENDNGQSESDDDDDDHSIDDEQENEEEDEENYDLSTKPSLPDASSGTILFLRNVPFEATMDELRDIFTPFGPLRYVRVTLDKMTGHSKGTAFACFWTKEAADKVLALANEIQQLEAPGPSLPVKGKQSHPSSVLTIDPSSSLASRLTIHGRVLNILPALSREEASHIETASLHPARQKDKRNLYLLREGLPPPSNPFHLPVSELNIRQQSYTTRAQMLKSNPSLYLSLARLSIRRLPLWVGEKELKILGRLAVKHFDQELKAGKRQDLSEDEKKIDDDMKQGNPRTKKKSTLIRQAKVVRVKDRVDPFAKARNASEKDPLGRSKGYGFLEFTSHSLALKCLRWLNFNVQAIKVLVKEIRLLKEMKAAQGLFVPDDLIVGDIKEESEDVLQARGGRGLMVEFSIENVVVNKRRQERSLKQDNKVKEGQKDVKVEEPVVKKPKLQDIAQPSKSGLSDAQKLAISAKRRRKAKRS